MSNQILQLIRNCEDDVVENRRARLVLTAFVVPPFAILAVRFFGEQVLSGWVVLFAAYCLTLFVAAVSKLFAEPKTLTVTKNLLAMMTPLVWGFILAHVYFFAYLLLFDPENLSPR
jgi:hypothetical protein